ncbi:AbrB/MazE/SpoVT family DNA-binding domain-containing protein [candidate division KSB1 bacterium]|nr:AbrB/MazE/SpoVT family DNA-binding domain-containing protein [candidate division KSB1 bacterium]
MFTQTIAIDQAGRITLPKQILDALGLRPESELVIELKQAGAVIKPKHPITPITERIAAMNLPVADWNVMEKEIEAGRLE